VSSTATSIQVEWDPAYDDGGSPIAQYSLFVDEVEGLGTANIESWSNVYTGSALTYTLSTGLTAKKSYRFKVHAISEESLTSLSSKVAEFVAASLPPTVTFPATPFPETSRTSL